jgi:uncharacterized lipoprotein YddW (UPF0748 family)
VSFLCRLWCGVIVATLCVLSTALPRDAAAQTSEFRAFWADAFHEGFKSTAEIDSMVSRAVAGRYNAIVAEVMAYQDNRGNFHGAYWNSSIVPKAQDISGGIDPLAYLVQRAHGSSIEVHPWLVAYRVCATWPPQGNGTLMIHPEYFMVPQASMGSLATVGDDYVLDPGSPGAQEYLVSIVRELVTNYAIDGIHWDYIRYTQADAGYPSSTTYTNSSLARFRRITNYPGTPPPTGYAPWDDFRRRGVTELVRRVRAEIPSITGNPRQPLRHSAALVTWGDAPSTFSGSSAWARFQNWEEWMRLGFLDTGIPMTYYDENVYPTWYRNWVEKEIAWSYQRHMVVGPAIYNNTFANSLTQMQYARSAGADGLCTYSYWATKDPSENDWSWYAYIASSLFTTAVPTPVMTWHNAATATEGTLWGRVTDGATGLPVDDAGVQVGSMASVKTDGNGYYAVTMIPASGAGTAYSVTASRSGYTSVTHSGVAVVAGSVRRDDLALGGGTAKPTITQHPQPQSTCPGGMAEFSVMATGPGTLSYQWQRNGGNLTDGDHYCGVTTPTLTISDADSGDVASYRCAVSNAGGTIVSNQALLTLLPTAVTRQPQPQNVPAGETATFVVAATGQGTLAYQWQKNGADLDDVGHYSGTMTAVLTISGADEADVAGYRCVVTGGCGSVLSNEVTLTLRGSGPEFIVESRSGGEHHDQYSEDGALADSSIKSGAPGTTAGIGSRWAYMAREIYGVNRATYAFTPTTTGLYQIFVTWPSSSNASANLEHVVAHAGGLTSVFLNQNSISNPVGGNRWNPLGQYYLNADATYTVTQTNENPGDTAVYRADAVKWQLVGPPPQTPIVMQQPLPKNVWLGATATFAVTATGAAPLAYRWQKDGGDLNDGGHYAGTTTSALTVARVDANDAGSYRCVVTNGNGDAISDGAILSAAAAPGDFDQDGDVDLQDFGHFQGCFNGPNATPAQSQCSDSDMDHDTDVDLSDFVEFQSCFNGPNRPPAC